MVGGIGVAFVLYTWLGRVPAEPKRPSAAAGVFWGAMTGITSTLAQAGAPPFQMFMLPQKLDKLTLVGTTLIFFAALNWMKLVPYSALGQFTAQTSLTSALLMPLAIATNSSASGWCAACRHETFYRIAYGLMFLISLELIRSGVLGLSWRPSAASWASCYPEPDDLASTGNQGTSGGNHRCAVSTPSGSRVAVVLGARRASPAAAQDFFAGKTIELLIGAQAEAAVTTSTARVVARHIGRHIPGNPNIVPKKHGWRRERAGGRLHPDVAPKDGTVCQTSGRAR